MELVKFEGQLSEMNIESMGNMDVMTLEDSGKVGLFKTLPYWIMVVQPGMLESNKKKFKDHLGEFFFPAHESDNEDEDEANSEDLFSKELRVLPIGLRGYSRVYKEEKNPDALCWSADGVWPGRDIDMPFADKCGTWEFTKEGKPYIKDLCPEAIWENKTPPKCRRKAQWIFFDLDRRAPVVFPLAGTAMGAFNKFERTKVPVQQLKALNGTIDPRKYYLRLRTTGEGTYYKLSLAFATSEDLDPGKFLPAVAWYQQNVLPELGVDPEKPTREDGVAAAAELSEEDKEALAAQEKELAESAQNFEV